ncbi:hypothetical protein M5U04_02925 [Xenorhabdus sp. XENO-1]|nr:hypothetical protein [Xenorhabdus bovienii subsp. africana]
MGLTLNVTASNNYYYAILPLPIFSIEYNRLSFQSTYIPGTYNSMDVIFGWLRWQW